MHACRSRDDLHPRDGLLPLPRVRGASRQPAIQAQQGDHPTVSKEKKRKLSCIERGDETTAGLPCVPFAGKMPILIVSQLCVKNAADLLLYPMDI